jgi:hypothetical protein
MRFFSELPAAEAILMIMAIDQDDDAPVLSVAITLTG